MICVGSVINERYVRNILSLDNATRHENICFQIDVA